MRDVIVGLVAGLAAVIGSRCFIPQTRPVTEVRELSTVWGASSLAELGKPLIPSTQPDPIAARLEIMLDRFEFKDKTLDQAIGALAERTGCNFFVDWRALESAGFMRDARSSLSVQNLRASTTLKRLLDQFANDSPPLRLRHRVEDGVVRISTGDGFASSSVLRVYDVRDLIQIDLDRQRQTGRAPPEHFWGDREAGEALMKLLQDHVDAESWRNNGGSLGSASYFAGRLIVNQSPENHDLIYQILGAIRRKQH